MFKVIKNHKWRAIFSIIMIIITIIFIWLLVLLKYKFDISLYSFAISDKQQEIIIFNISLNNWCNIITVVATTFGVPWGLHQYDSARREKQQQKAYEIANQFAIEFMDKLEAINITLTNNLKFVEILKKVDENKLKSFSKYEIEEITQSDTIIDDFLEVLCSEEIQNSYEYYLNNSYNRKEREAFNSKFIDLVESTLNRLEAICININSQAAGSQYIYQSLHQEFLKSVHILSILISKSNKNNFDKFYTNVIYVYNIWNKQKQHDKKIFEKTRKKIDKLQNKSKIEIDKLLFKEPDKI